MKKLVLLTCLISATTHVMAAGEVTITSPNDICMSNICIHDDISKYPSVMKKHANYLKIENDQKNCKREYFSALPEKITNNGQPVNVSFEPYVTQDEKQSLRVSSMYYKLNNSSSEYTDKVVQEYTSKFVNLNPPGQYSYNRGWNDEKQNVSIEIKKLTGAVLSVSWIAKIDYRLSLNKELREFKPACNAVPKL